jgi:hypothetical protein
MSCSTEASNAVGTAQAATPWGAVQRAAWEALAKQDAGR